MNKNSYLCNLIYENPDVWREICRYRKIKIRESGNLAIFNYDIMADFKDPYVQEARGIIIDTKSCDVVCFPFRKFGNYHESYADKIDWNSAKVQEKIDGSIVKLWFNKNTDNWQWSTNSCIDAKDAKLSSGKSFYDLIIKTKEIENIKKCIDEDIIFHPEYTYIFELVSPFNQIVIKYPETKLYMLGIRENETGKEIYINNSLIKLYFDIPREYPVHTLDDALNAVKALNKAEYPDMEGFVVMDKDFNRIKVKSPEYLIFHHAINNKQINKERAFELLTSDDFDYNSFIKEIPAEVRERLLHYKTELLTVKRQIEDDIDMVREWANKGLSRKEIALRLKGNKYSSYCFKALDSKKKAEDIIKESGNMILKFIKDFDMNKNIDEEEDEEYEKDK